MRSAFINTLTEVARDNDDIFLLTGDLGFSVFEGFQKEFPKRFFNAGVAEQNMIGIAAGLALSGKIVFIYSIIPFVTLRCLEQIRNDLCIQNLNVNIVGMGVGLHYGSAGPTHHAIEDIGLMRVLPNMTILSPSTSEETMKVINSVVSYDGPIYIRLGRSYGPIEPCKKGDFCIGKGILVEEGEDITLISTGSILYNAKLAIEILKNKGIHTRLINIHTIKPIDKNIILKAAEETKALFAIEEHSIIGGLGSAISEILAESDCKVMFRRLALSDSFIKDIGDRGYLIEKNNLSVEKISATILAQLNKVNL